MAKNKKPTKQPTTKPATWSINDVKQTEPTWKKWVGNLLPIILLVVGLIVAGCSLLSTESDVLYKAQELSLWVPGDTFYQMFSIYPGGWLSWAGAFMTDFFYNPATGVWLLMAAWALIMALLAWLFRLRGKSLLLTALVPILLLACLTQTGYWLYYQKLHGHLWVPTLAVLFNLIAALGFKCISHSSACCKKSEEACKCKKSMEYVSAFAGIIYLLLFAWFGYQAMGAWSFLGIALMIVPNSKEAFKDTMTSARTLGFIAIGIAAAVLVPRIAYNNVYEQTMITEIYTAGMPCFQYGSANVGIYRVAYYALALSFIPMVLAGWIPQNFLSKSKKLKGILSIATIVVLLLGALYVVKDRWNHDKNFHAEITMSNAVNRQDWEGVLTTMRGCASDTIPVTRAMVMMKNLALFRLNRSGDEILLYPEGGRQQNIDEWYKYGEKMYTYPAELDTIKDPAKLKEEKAKLIWPIKLSQIAGKMLYYNYGKLNFSYRWCMEDCVEFGWRADEIKTMAKCCLLKGEWQAARKYLNILKKTRNHKEWAEHYEQFIGQVDKIKEEPEFNQICYLKEYGNRLDGDNTLVELYLLQTFANGTGSDPVYQEQTLISAMLMKDIDLFWPRFARYCTMHAQEKGFTVPRYYQEAAWLYSKLEPQRPSVLYPGCTNEQAAAHMPFDQSVKDRFDKFMDYNHQHNAEVGQQLARDYEQRKQQAKTEEEQKALAEEMDIEFNKRMAALFKPMFGDTFYYFYYLVRNQKTN